MKNIYTLFLNELELKNFFFTSFDQLQYNKHIFSNYFILFNLIYKANRISRREKKFLENIMASIS